MMYMLLSLLFLVSCSLVASQNPADLIHLANDGAFLAKTALLSAILLGGTMFLGKIITRLSGIPLIASYILAGIILGPSLLDCTSWPLFTLLSSHVSGEKDIILFFMHTIASFFTVPLLMWIAGHETELEHIKKVSIIACVAGVLGALLPVLFIGAVLWGLRFSFASAGAMGLVFAATSVSIPVALFVSLKKMNSRPAQATLGAAVVDDIVAVVALSLFTLVCIPSTEAPSLAMVGARVILGMIIMTILGSSLAPKIFSRIGNHGPLLIGFGFVLLWLHSSIAELVGGLAGITGAYFAGYFHKQHDNNHSMLHAIQPVVNAILVPLYLALIGLSVNMRVVTMNQWVLVIGIVIVAIASKFLAGFAAVALHNRISNQRWSFLESSIFGASMVARGEVGLVIASIMASSGLLDASLYSVAVIGITLTTIAAPLLLDLLGRLEDTSYQASVTVCWDLDQLEELRFFLEQQGHAAVITGNNVVTLVDKSFTIAVEHAIASQDEKQRTLRYIGQHLVSKGTKGNLIRG